MTKSPKVFEQAVKKVKEKVSLVRIILNTIQTVTPYNVFFSSNASFLDCTRKILLQKYATTV